MVEMFFIVHNISEFVINVVTAYVQNVLLSF